MKLAPPSLMAVFLLFNAAAPGADWPQFRGPNGAGIAATGAAGFPEHLGRDAGVIWRTPLEPGISSPCIARDRIFLTTFKAPKELATLSLERSTGRILWRAGAPADRVEEVHSIGSPATPTPASDGDRVYSFFGSFGLLCHDRAGVCVWKKPLGPFKNNYGQASSPVLAGDLVILNCDQDLGSFLLAARKDTGETVWKVERPGFPRGFSTPVLWDGGDSRQVLVAGTLRLVAYSVSGGNEVWSVHGLARIVNPTPVIGDGLLFIASYAPGGDADDRISMAPFDEFAKEVDANKDGSLELGEIPEGPFRSRFPQIDYDKDGRITPREWADMSAIFAAARNSLMAVRPGGKGDVTETQIAWRHERAIPYVPSPLYHEGLVYLVKDNAIFTCLDAATGKAYKQGRLPAPGNYYASPVAAAGRIYTVSRDGGVCVIRAGRDWEVVATAELGESCMATPALADGKVYLRTERQLYCFGEGRSD